ncbi:Mth938-like domain-containing protein [Candidatus Pandoraea novymonadis]|uniref:Mth938-like domain-containing protein n=1 Tax=Candidatus Pandoraea novymonadis TaxID=1808959 RepID=A0ABX5FEB8_9BURK|nr:Mth938-like domain-containing protein [Candidatus Pandoraea novymonadis]PSB92059.1 hypothetical protein BZL35_00285 [Candidatus Pandoraea novymonadis]
MKFYQDPLQTLNTITGYGDNHVEINKVCYMHSVIVFPDGDVRNWSVSHFDALLPEHFESLISLSPEVVIFGSGKRLRLQNPRLTASLAELQIGVEAMNFQAACRTYNILMAEGRKVVLALLIESETTT